MTSQGNETRVKFKGFEAWVSVNNNPLPHYGIEFLQDGKTVSCWVPSEAGAEFSVTLRGSTLSYFSQRVDIQAHMTIDGSVHSRRLKPDRLDFDCYDTVRTSATTARRLVFSTVELTDDDAYLGKTGPKNLGEISLSLQRVNVVRNMEHVKGVEVPVEQKVHERSKKGMTHCVKFGAEMRVPATRSSEVTYIDQSPFAIFVFKYRSIDVLCANGIAPRLPSTVDTPIKSPEACVNRKRTRGPSPHTGIKREKVATKTENDSDSDDVTVIERPKGAKKEPDNINIKVEKSRPVKKEVIDLTHL